MDDEELETITDNPLEAIDYCYEKGWTDGLPVIPPEESRVEQMLAMDEHGVGARRPAALHRQHALESPSRRRVRPTLQNQPRGGPCMTRSPLRLCNLSFGPRGGGRVIAARL